MKIYFNYKWDRMMLKKLTFYVSLLVLGFSFAFPLQAEQIEGTPGTAFKSEIISMQQIIYYHSQQPPDTSMPAKSKKFHLGIPSDNEIGSGSTIRSPYVPRFQPMGGASPTFSPEPTAAFGSLVDNNRTVPPDVHGAVGPDHLMTTHNSEVRIQNKSGSVQSTVSLNSFWASVATSTFDPRVYYDPYEEKWFSIACGTAGGQNSIMAGASYTSSPSSTWSMHAIDSDPGDTTWFDYPSVGFNKKWIVVTGNMFRNSTNAFEGTVVYVIDKMKLYDDGQLSYTKFSFDNLLGYFTIVPHETFDETLENMYMFCTWNGNSGGKSYFRMFHISGSLGNEVFNNNSVYTESNNTFAWSVPGEGSCPQLGTTREIIANDARIQNAVYRDGSVWFTLTAQLPAAAPTRASVLWYEVDVSGGQPLGTALQEGKIDDGNDVFHYAFPSITVNKNNDALIGYTSFSPNQYASCNYSFRSESDALNSMRSTHNYKSGLASYYKTYGSGRNRWGDYSQTMIDPDDEVSFWTLQEYAETPGGGRDRWGTWWAKVCGTPQTPTSITQPSTHCVGTEESYSTGSTGDA
ncbi:MAG: hypothetical protein KAH48_04790, partial [Chlorobi bacterium]|nr:hypothetical protein [Chlorobiota bacterium]